MTQPAAPALRHPPDPARQVAAEFFALLDEMNETHRSLALWRHHGTPAPVAADGQRLMGLYQKYPDLFRSWLAHGRPMPSATEEGRS